MRPSITTALAAAALVLGGCRAVLATEIEQPALTNLGNSPALLSTPTATANQILHMNGSTTPISFTFKAEEWEEVHDDSVMARAADSPGKTRMLCNSKPRNKAFPRTFGTLGQSNTMTPTEKIFQQFRQAVCSNKCERLPMFPENIHVATRVGSTGCVMAVKISPLDEIIVGATDTTDEEECNEEIDKLLYKCWGKNRREMGALVTTDNHQYVLGKQKANMEMTVPHEPLTLGLNQFAPHFNARCYYSFEGGRTSFYDWTYHLDVGIPDDEFAETWVADLRRLIQCNEDMQGCAVWKFRLEANQVGAMRFEDGSMVHYRVIFTSSENPVAQREEGRLNMAFNLPEYAIGCRWMKPFYFDNISPCEETNSICPYPQCWGNPNGFPKLHPWEEICAYEGIPTRPGPIEAPP